MLTPDPTSRALVAGGEPALMPTAKPAHAELVPPELVTRLERYSRQAMEGMALSTLRAIKADWGLYLDWCVVTHTKPLKLVPANLTQTEQEEVEEELTDEIKAFFVNAIARGLRRSTLNRYLYTIRLAHKAARVPDLTTLPGWKAIWKGLVKRLAKDGRNRKRPAAPLGQASVATVVIGLNATTKQTEAGRLRALRDTALLCLASDTLARREELARVRIEEISPRESGLQLEIPNSKTDQEGHGLFRHVSPATAEHINRWKAAAKLESGPLFRSVKYRLEKVKETEEAKKAVKTQKKKKRLRRILVIGERPLADKQIARIFKRRMVEAGLDATRISGHSTRIGSTHDLFKRGYTGTQIAQVAGWANEQMVNYYCRELATEESAMALARRDTPLPAPSDTDISPPTPA